MSRKDEKVKKEKGLNALSRPGDRSSDLLPSKKARMINLYFFLYGENEEELPRKMDFSFAYTASPTAHIQAGQGELC